MGSRYQAREGLTVGRAKADIVIKDPKISGTHAKIQRDGKQQFILMDLNSSNGLYIGGRRVRKVALFQDVIFEIGRTQFKVLVVSEKEAAQMDVVVNWKDALHNKFASLEPVEVPPIQTFLPALKLSATQGVQADQEWVLGWGPRVAGKFSNDICLTEPKLKDFAFKIHSNGSQVIIESLADNILLNSQPFQTAFLNFGDIISVGESQIKVLAMDQDE